MKDWITHHQRQALLLRNTSGLIVAALAMFSPLIREHQIGRAHV